MNTLVTVKKWSGSLAVRIPREFARRYGIKFGCVIDLERVKVTGQKRRRYTAAELMVGYKPEHRHGEWDIRNPIGREIW